GSPRALTLPDDPHRGQEARSARVRRDASPHRSHGGAGADLPARASGDAQGDLQDPPRRHRRRYRRQDHPPRGQEDGSSLPGVRRPSEGGRSPPPSVMKYLGVDVGSTTVKAVVMEDGKVTWQDYQRHNTRQAEKVVEFLQRMETEAGVTTGRDRV